MDPLDFEDAPVRGRLEARFLHLTAGSVHRMFGKRKAAVLGRLSGTVLELGAGTGVNLRYYPAGIRVIAVEPNPAMHPRLRTEAERHPVEVQIRTERAEQLTVPDRSVDAVVSTLVLCSVTDPDEVLAEAHRVLRPGGTLFVLEHVVARPGSLTRRLQRLVKRPHRWCFNGCEVDRDLASVLERSDFVDLDLDQLDIGPGALYTRHQIIGTARRRPDGPRRPG